MTATAAPRRRARGPAARELAGRGAGGRGAPMTDPLDEIPADGLAELERQGLIVDRAILGIEEGGRPR